MKDKTLKLRQFTVKVLIVPPLFMERLSLAQFRTETRVIQGYTLKDAKRRARIQ
jgi:hypothetical protein